MKKGAKANSAKRSEKEAKTAVEVPTKSDAGDAAKKEKGKKDKKDDKKDVGKKKGKKKKSSSELSKAEKTEESVGDTSINPPSQAEWGEEFEEEGVPKVHVVLSRTSMLLQDYREFKAARTIQTRLRGWFTRHMLAKRRRAAIVIQKAWRGFYYRRFYYRHLENTLQQRIMDHFNKSAIRIQSLWRGFWVRENVHDQHRLTGVQVTAAEDLLYCVAFKLHHLLRTHQIPGVYSLRNSTCLSNVEKLLVAMSFKEHNNKVRLARLRYENKIRQAKKKHEDSEFKTNVPYAGPNFGGICEPRCCGLYKEQDADKKMYRILRLYEKAMAEGESGGTKKKKKRVSHKKVDKRKKKIYEPPFGDFCGDIINSMKRWSIIDPEKLTIDANVFKTPENVEHFLREIQSKLSLMNPRCHCYVNSFDWRECATR